MITKNIYVGKTKEEALEKGLNELELSETEIFYEENYEEGKLFKAPKVTVTIYKKEDIIKEIKEFVKDLSKKINIVINAEVREKEDIFNVLLISDNNAILIGKDGRTLRSIQIIIRQLINKQVNLQVKVNVDASNYKAKKQNRLEYEIKKIAKEVLSSGIGVNLEPMNSYDRRVVHNVISNFEELLSKSAGNEPDRYVVITKKD